MCKCPICNQPLFKLVSYADPEYENQFYDGEINRELMIVNDCYNLDLYVELDDEPDYNQRWCDLCKEIFIFCCGERPVLKSCCSVVWDGWYTFEDNKFVKHPKAEWPFDYLDKDSNIDVESLQITDLNDPRLSHIDITGPDGGCPFSVKCRRCDSELWFRDK